MVSTISQPDTQSSQPALVLDMTLEEFLQLPETKPASEFIKGKIYQKTMPNGEHSTLQGELTSRINQIGKPSKLVYAFPELRCTLTTRSIVPDISVFTWERIPRNEDGGVANKINIAPDWIIEILSPDQSVNRVIEKIIFALEYGTKLAWLIDPERKRVMIFQDNQMPEIKIGEDKLLVPEVIKGWQLSVLDLFSWLYVDL